MYNNLKKLRKSLGLTQEEFGQQFGIMRTTYSNYEAGNTEMNSDMWIAIAERYNLSVDYLMDLTDNPHGTKSDLSEMEQKLLNAYRSTDDEHRRIVNFTLSI